MSKHALPVIHISTPVHIMSQWGHQIKCTEASLECAVAFLIHRVSSPCGTAAYYMHVQSITPSYITNNDQSFEPICTGSVEYTCKHTTHTLHNEKYHHYW